ncbi:MAG: cell envelope integrity protein TolA, partial [Thiotrichaceae bacterium]|nr:cell envelope integrity protein TolA [Thiotrichaceae bacterium]
NRRWIRPTSLKGKFKCTLRIKLYPGGGVMDVSVIISSGNKVFDRSATNAVFKADPLPVPKDPQAFANFKTFKLIFKPE